MNITEKIKLNKEYQEVRAAIAGDAPLVEKIKLNKRLQELRVLLGGAGQQPAPQPQPQPQQESGAQHVAVLNDVVQGKLDSTELAQVYGMLKAAIQGLIDVEAIQANEALANEALEHWAQLDLTQNG